MEIDVKRMSIHENRWHIDEKRWKLIENCWTSMKLTLKPVIKDEKPLKLHEDR